MKAYKLQIPTIGNHYTESCRLFVIMSSILLKKRVHECTTSLVAVSARKMMKRRAPSVLHVALTDLAENDGVAKALLDLKTSIDEQDIPQNPIASSDSSTSLSSSSSSESDDSAHPASPPSPSKNSIQVEQILRSKLSKKPSNPDEFVQTLLLLKGRTVQFQSAATLGAKGFFPKVTEEFSRGYTVELVTAVRNDDVAALRRIHEENPTLPILCGSKFGDSIIHLACRRSCVNVLEYLLCEMNLSPQLVCDYGRTPLHDALWNTKLNEQMLTLLMNKCPELLFVTDNRGSTPLSYTPRDQWTNVCRFLAQHIKRNGTFLSDSHKNTNAVHVVPLEQ